MDWKNGSHLVLAALAALLLVGFDGGSCGDTGGDVGEPPRAVNDLRPGPSCGAVCDIWCEFGNVLDANGCPTCACNSDPGTGQGGSAGGCRPVACEIWCEDGFATGPDGCETCRCNRPPRPGPGCSDVLCDVWCEYGNVLDENGCPTCACNPNPRNPCAGLGERACNATPGCLGVYEGSSCACSPCPPGVDCFCDCPVGSEPTGSYLGCERDRDGADCPVRPPPAPACRTTRDCGDEQSCVDGVCVGGQRCRGDAECPEGQSCAGNLCVADPAHYECRTDADCRPGGTCEHYVTCQAIGCPPPGSRCVYPQPDRCDGAQLNTDNQCVTPDGRVVDLACCRNTGR